jgi:peptidoglycan hydrolase-like protein with peptidoglycan-binding domain
LLLGAAALPACSNMMGGNSTRTASAQPQPLANEMVRQVQAKLQQDGYYKQGAVDGLWGSGTEMAVQNFQRDHNLPVTGKLSLPTLQALNVQPDQTVMPQGNNNPPPPPPPPATNR